MDNHTEAIIAEFTRRMALLNLGIKRYLQLKFRQHGIDLTFEMWQVLMCLWRADGINQQEIANIIVKDKASITNLIDNLVKRQLVYRQEDSADRRNKLIFLTHAGKHMRQEIQPWVQEMYATASTGINMDAVAQILTELDTMRDNLANTAG